MDQNNLGVDALVFFFLLLLLSGVQDSAAFIEISQIKLSPDHRFIAFSVDVSGNEIYSVFVKDISSAALFKQGEPVLEKVIMNLHAFVFILLL